MFTKLGDRGEGNSGEKEALEPATHTTTGIATASKEPGSTARQNEIATGDRRGRVTEKKKGLLNRDRMQNSSMNQQDTRKAGHSREKMNMDTEDLQNKG